MRCLVMSADPDDAVYRPLHLRHERKDWSDIKVELNTITVKGGFMKKKERVHVETETFTGDGEVCDRWIHLTKKSEVLTMCICGQKMGVVTPT